MTFDFQVSVAHTAHQANRASLGPEAITQGPPRRGGPFLELAEVIGIENEHRVLLRVLLSLPGSYFAPAPKNVVELGVIGEHPESGVPVFDSTRGHEALQVRELPLDRRKALFKLGGGHSRFFHDWAVSRTARLQPRFSRF